MSNPFPRLTLLVFLLAVGLRIMLAMLNLESNDSHFEVIEIIMRENRLPGGRDAWEGFQPKLFHLAAAGLLRLIPLPFWASRIHLTQLLNAFAGSITIGYILLFLRRQPFSEKTRFWAFSLVALNPKLIGINAQVTNDSFVILFSTLAIYFAARYFQKGAARHYLLMTLFAICAGISKGNGLVLFMVLLGTWIVQLAFWIRRPALEIVKRIALPLNFFILCYLPLVAFFGQYGANYVQEGTPFGINIEPQPFPHIFEKTYVNRPGVTSIADSYFTFRWIDLLKTPYISTQGSEAYPRHRTSLWTQVYARANSLHFDQWPLSWQTQDAWIINIGRVIFVLALVPAGLFLLGLLRRVSSLRKPSFLSEADYLAIMLHCLALAGYIAFLVIYTLRYRDFATMKAIFIFPALISMTFFLGSGLNRLPRSLRRFSWLPALVDACLAVLLCLYTADVISLLIQLS
jgi:hypothetical protein